MKVGSSELLVLGDAGNLHTAISTLRNSGFTVHVAAADNCRQQIKQIKPNLVLLAMSDPLKPMLDLPGCIKKLDADLPIILLCNLDENSDKKNQLEEMILPLLQQGAEHYVVDANQNTQLLMHTVSYAIESKLVSQQQALRSDSLREDYQRLKQDQLSGLRVQNRLLPETPTKLGSFVLQHRIFPSIILSGDSVNYFPLSDGRVLFYLADVSGHGVASALVSVALGGLTRRLRREFGELGLDTSADVLCWFNQQIMDLNLEQHITMFLGILDDKQNIMQYSNAAHFPGAIMRNGPDIRYLEMGGLPLGMCLTEYNFQDIKIGNNFDLVLFSDGVLEIMAQTSIKHKEEYLLSLIQLGTTDIDTLSAHLGLDDKREVPDDIAIFTVAREI